MSRPALGAHKAATGLSSCARPPSLRFNGPRTVDARQAAAAAAATGAAVLGGSAAAGVAQLARRRAAQDLPLLRPLLPCRVPPSRCCLVNAGRCRLRCLFCLRCCHHCCRGRVSTGASPRRCLGFCTQSAGVSVETSSTQVRAMQGRPAGGQSSEAVRQQAGRRTRLPRPDSQLSPRSSSMLVWPRCHQTRCTGPAQRQPGSRGEAREVCGELACDGRRWGCRTLCIYGLKEANCSAAPTLKWLFAPAAPGWNGEAM